MQCFSQLKNSYNIMKISEDISVYFTVITKEKKETLAS